MKDIKLYILIDVILIVTICLYLFLKPINKEIIIYFNGKPLHISVDGSGQEMAEGHNYETGIGYTMRRFGSNIVINAKYDPMPPSPAFDSTAKITFECDGLDSLLLDSINNGTKQIKFILNGSK